MTPPSRHIDPQDPTSLAIAMTGLHGDVAVLQREVSSNIQNLTSAVQAIQAEQRHQSDQMGELVRLQQQQVANSEGLTRAFTELAAVKTDTLALRDAVTDARGRIKGLWMAGGVVTFLSGAIVTMAWNRVNEQFAANSKEWAEAKAERAQLEARRQATHDADVNRLQIQIDRQRTELEGMRATGGAR